MKTPCHRAKYLLAFLLLTIQGLCECRPKTSAEKVEKTLEAVLDFFQKTKGTDVYHLFDDFPKNETASEECCLKPSHCADTQSIHSDVYHLFDGSPNNETASQERAPKPSNCADIQLMGSSKNGVYEIHPRGRKDGKPIKVYCDLETDGGGWTVFQRRGSFGGEQENFFRNWNDYKNGFGNLEEEFWLGNENLFLLTWNDRTSLRVELEDYGNTAAYSEYTDFLVEGENALYNMTFRKYSGTVGDSLAYHNGYTFATYDRDNALQCSNKYKGGWWYDTITCYHSNLNGLYKATDPNNYTCLNWHQLKNDWRCLKRSEMKLRPNYFIPALPK